MFEIYSKGQKRVSVLQKSVVLLRKLADEQYMLDRGRVNRSPNLY